MTYAFGGYSLDSFVSGLGLIFQSKDVSMPEVSPVMATVGRRYGAMKSGEVIGPRDIAITLKVVGSSRADLVARLDALKKALRLRGQTLIVYEDLRYYNNVDCLKADAALKGAANIATCTVDLIFRAYDPVAYAAVSSSYDTGTVALTSSGGTWNFGTVSVTGGGTTETFPLIRLTNKTSTGATTLTTARNSGTSYTTLPVAATSFSGLVGDQLLLSNGTNTQTVTVNANFSVGATSITVTSFTANATYPIGASVTKVAAWSAISITQTNDNQTLSTYATATVPLPTNNADYVDIQCDPATGMSIITNGSGARSDPVGVFPTLSPDSTSFTISITSASAVSAQAVFSWSSRYL